jgi:hypothetical protein
MLTIIQEASQATMELHDDDPDHFEFILKYMYTHCFDAAAIDTLAAGDRVRRVTIPLGIYLVADKYNMPAQFFHIIVSDTKLVLHDRAYHTPNVLLSLVPLYYGMINKADHSFGTLLVKEILRRCRKATSSNDFKNMVKAHLVFAADVALLLGEEGVSYYCEHCEESYEKLFPDALKDMKIGCQECSKYTDDISLTAGFL